MKAKLKGIVVMCDHGTTAEEIAAYGLNLDAVKEAICWHDSAFIVSGLVGCCGKIRTYGSRDPALLVDAAKEYASDLAKFAHIVEYIDHDFDRSLGKFILRDAESEVA